MVRGYSTETLRAFLDIASDMSLPIAEVRSTPLGLIIPVDLAIKAGLIEVPCTENKPKRSYSKKTKVEVPQPELPWDE
jgi:hypothetical protein